MTISGILAIFAIAGSLQTPAEGQKVTYRTVAKSADAVLRDLSNLTGLQLSASSETAHEVLVLQVKDAEPSALMKSIAQATSATWRKTDRGFTLTRPSEIAKREQDDEQAQLVKAIRKAAADAKAKAEKAKPFDEAGAKAYAARCASLADRIAEQGYNKTTLSERDEVAAASPAGLLAQRLGECASADVLARMEPGDRVVFSTSPTRAQVAFGTGGEAAWRRFLLEWQAFAGVPSLEQPDTPARYPRDDFMAQMTDARRSGRAPTRALVVATWDLVRQDIHFDLEVVDDRGSILCRAPSQLKVDDLFSSLEKKYPQLRTGGATAAPDEIQLSKLAREWEVETRAMSGGTGEIESEVPADLMEWGLHPEKCDPLSLHPSEFLLALADDKGWNLVADVPDSAALVSVMAAMAAEPKLADVQEVLAFTGKMTFATADGFTVVRPVLPARARLERIDRESLGVVMRACDAEGGMTLDAASTFAMANTLAALQTYQLMVFGMVSGSEEQFARLLGSARVLRLYGLLGPSQKQALAKGAQIALEKLSNAQMDMVAGMAYGAGLEGNTNSALQGSRNPGGVRMVGSLDALQTEPTEVFPTGLPRNGTMSLDLTAEDVAVACSKPYMHSPYTAESLASEAAMRERPEIFGENAGPPFPNLFWFGKRSKATFNFAFTSELSMERSLEFTTFGRKGKPGPLDSLPASFRAAYAKSLEEMRARYKQMGGGAPVGPSRVIRP